MKNTSCADAFLASNERDGWDPPLEVDRKTKNRHINHGDAQWDGRSSLVLYSDRTEAPVLRDLAILPDGCFSWFVFHFHAGGLGESLARASTILRPLARLGYSSPDFAIKTSNAATRWRNDSRETQYRRVVRSRGQEIMENRSVLVTGGSGFIGINLVDRLIAEGYQVTNLDKVPPAKGEHRAYWTRVDILDAVSLDAAIATAQATIVIHLAARTDSTGKLLAGYTENTDGVANVLSALKKLPTLQRFVATSTQFVVGPGPLPAHDLDFRPHTVYGESKVIGEQLVRKAELACTWTIIRPTNIWGPWHPRYPREFWRVLKRGLYVHPGDIPVIRSYGYVENIVEQIVKIITAPPAIVDRRVFYVGDPPLNLLDWANAFSRALRGREVLIVPRALFRGIVVAGDLANLFGVRIPITSSRFQSMTQDYLTPMAPTFEALGPSQISLSEGVERTVRWLRQQDPFWGTLG